MHEFDTYINSIISSLKISKRKKKELIEEFMDHLQMLKLDYINSGMTEEDAVMEAIKKFGDSNVLKSMLSRTILTYRTIPNTAFGIALTFLFYTGGSHIPCRGIDLATDHGFLVFLNLLIFFTVLFIPVGYFMPIISEKIRKVQNAFLVSLLMGTIMGIILSIHFKSIQTELIVSAVVGGVLGSALGFAALTIVNKFAYKYGLS